MFKCDEFQLKYILDNLIVYIFRNDENNIVPVGTGFIIDNHGRIMTARHNIETDFICSNRYLCRYKGIFYYIMKIMPVFNIEKVDIAVFETNVESHLPEINFFRFYQGVESDLIGKNVFVIGCENKKSEILCASGVISLYKDSCYYIQGGNFGTGFSGAPVILKENTNILIGVMAKRENINIEKSYIIDTNRFGISYACSIRPFKFLSEVLEMPMCKEANLFNAFNKTDWNRILGEFLYLLQKQYIKNPNPIRVYYIFSNETFNNVNKLSLLNFLYKNKIYSYNLGRIYQLVGMILINSGSSEISPISRKYLEKACNIYCSVDNSTSDYFRLKIKSEWLIAVSHKLQKNYGLAENICRALLSTIEKENISYQLNYAESKLLPLREIAVLNQDRCQFSTILNNSDRFRINQLETFYTYRRIFEYYINCNKIHEANKILPILTIAYNNCKVYLYPIYKYSLMKNLYAFYRLKNDVISANRYFRLSYNFFAKFDLQGQMTGLMELKSKFDDWS